MKDEWVAVGGTSREGSTTHDFNTNPELIGEFVAKREGIGKFNQVAYDFTDTNGKPVTAWGSAMLNRQMTSIEPGMTVKIVFLGKKRSPNGTSYKHFEVYRKA